MDRVTEPYLLFTGVPIAVDVEGTPHTDPLWIKDLALHLDYIEDLSVACAMANRPPRADQTPIPARIRERITFIPLPAPNSRGTALRALPLTMATAWRAVGKARVVHTSFAAWPINLGWVACPIAWLRRKFLLTNVESSFWRATPGSPWHKRVIGFVAERLNRFCVRHADLRLFTSAAYMRDFLPPQSPRAFVNQASWIEDDWVLTHEEAVSSWDAKSGPVRLFFAARLIPEKGVAELLEAARAAGAAGAEFHLTILGDGPLQGLCREASREPVGKVQIEWKSPVPFGPEFFSLVRIQDVLVVPSLSDEQPRLLFDAYSQALPVIGSNTGGIREVVQDGVSGRLVAQGDIGALSEAMIWASRNRPALREMGLRGLTVVQGRTHRAMHLERSKIIRDALDARK